MSKENSYQQGMIDTLINMREVYGESVEECDLWQENCVFCCGACGLQYSIMESDAYDLAINESTHRADKCDVAIEEGLN